MHIVTMRSSCFISVHQQTLFTVIFFASFHEFVREAKIKVPKWWAKHRRQAEGEVSLTELHDDEGIVSQGNTSLVSKSFPLSIIIYFCSVIILTAFDSYGTCTRL